MIYSNRFSTSLQRLLVISLVLVLYKIFINVYFSRSFNFDDSIFTIDNLLLFTLALFSFATFWYVMAFLFKERIGAIIAFILELLIFILIIYLGSNMEYESFFYEYYYYIRLLLDFIPILVFGSFYFKNIKALFLLIPYLADCAINFYAFGNYFTQSELFVVLERLLGDEFWMISTTSENSYDNQLNLVSVLSVSLYYPLQLILYWLGISVIKQAKNNIKNIDFTFRTIYYTPMSQLTFSMMFWILNITFILLIFGGQEFYTEITGFGLAYMNLFRLIFLGLMIYITASIYRNLMIQYLFLINKYPSWMVYLINIPIINIVIWLIIVSLPQKKSGKESLEEGVVKEDVSTDFKSMQSKFIHAGKNKNIQFLYYVLIVFSYLLVFYFIGNKLVRFSDLEVLILFSSFILELAIITIYFQHHKAFIYLFVIEFSVFLLMNVFKIDLAFELVTIASVFNLIFFYSLFHFDQFKVVGVEELEIE